MYDIVYDYIIMVVSCCSGNLLNYMFMCMLMNANYNFTIVVALTNLMQFTSKSF